MVCLLTYTFFILVFVCENYDIFSIIIIII